MSETSPSVQRVENALTVHGMTGRIVNLPASTRTAQEAAAAIGCPVATIAKSLVFKLETSGQALLVIASGSHRVSEATLSVLVSDRVLKADAQFVRQATGFAIGGVPPVGHRGDVQVLIDASLLQYPEIWAAAGTPHAVFRLSPEELKRITGGRVVSVA